MPRAKASSARSETGRTAYLVLGMHRSGTSAVTQVLALGGCDLPQNLMGGDEHNAKGYFEPWKIALLNDGRLRAGDTAWDDIFAFPYRPLAAKPERQWLNRALGLFEEEYGEAQHPLLKDPRITVLMPFWRQVLADLDVAARCVIAVRHPLAVAGSLSRRNGFPAEKSVLVWTAYMLAAEAYTRDLPRAFVSFDGLLSDWRKEVKAIEAAHGAPLPNLTPEAGAAIGRFLTAELRHNEAQGDLAALGWAGALAAQVLAWFEAAAAGKPPPPAALDKAARELARRAADIGALVSPATRDLDAARAELLDLRQRLAFEQKRAKGLEAEIEALRRDAAEAAEAAVRLDAILAEG
ncbi:hypothetical protein [Phenylobacterium sp.]|jgi:hypothetical protein|uniref:sulfotransferase family protein n=1 Tax=Phenylobacterium sp. TaxID=1871053 RepID=UPI002F403058